MATLKIKSNMNTSVVIKGGGRKRTLAIPRSIKLQPGRYVITTKRKGDYVPDKNKIVVWVVKDREVKIHYSIPKIPASPLPDDPVIHELHDLTNKIRSEGYNGHPPVKPVRYSTELSTAAYLHAQDMALNDYFSHVSPTGSTFTERIRLSGFKGLPAGENIAAGFADATKAVYGWLASPGHCANLMSVENNLVGYGYYVKWLDTYTLPVIYWVQCFGYDR